MSRVSNLTAIVSNASSLAMDASSKEEEKRQIYEDLLHLYTSNGYKVSLMMTQVNSQGVLDMPSLTGLWQLRQSTAKE